MARTIEQLRRSVKDNLEREEVSPPGAARLLQTLNDAKNEVVGLLESLGQNWFVYRKDYTVAEGDTSIALPDGSEASYPALRRIIGLHRVSGTAEWPIEIVDLREKHLYGVDTNLDPLWLCLDEPSGRRPVLYREGMRLYFHAPSGSPSAQTLRLRYAAIVPDLDGDSADDEYALIPDEWLDLITVRATILELPSKLRAAAEKWNAIYAARIGQMRLAVPRSTRTGPMRIRRVTR